MTDHEQLRTDVHNVQAFFEAIIECVIGCGCWEPGWDDEERVRRILREGLAWSGPQPAPTVQEIHASLERLYAKSYREDFAQARELFELSFGSGEDFRAFFARCREVLAA